jgi:hypothetical protein
MSRRAILMGAGVLALAGGWAAFRPELLFVNKNVAESLEGVEAATQVAAARPTVLASGSFRTGAHETSGNATVYRLPGGERVLRLSDFATSNGPDVHVYMVAADDVTDNATVKSAGYVDLGSLKGNVGDQNYVLPPDVDLATHRAVTVWCARFSVNFGTAPLAAPHS